MNCLHVLLILNVRENDMKKSLHLRSWNSISSYDGDIPEPISNDLDSMDLQCIFCLPGPISVYNELL